MLFAGIVLAGVGVGAWLHRIPVWQTVLAVLFVAGFVWLDREARATGEVMGLPVTSCVLGIQCDPETGPKRIYDCDR